MNSMTGFGRGTATVGATTATVELRSVNNRFLEVSARLPRLVADREADLQTLLRGRLERGRIGVSVQLDTAGAEALPVRVNVEAARAYGALLRELADAAGIAAPVTLDHLLRFAEVLTTDAPADAGADEAWQATTAAIEIAVAELVATRQQEGEALRADLEARIGALERATAEVERLAPERADDARVRLVERLERVLEDSRIQPERVEMEIALLAEKLDVTEECVRLRAHLGFFRDALAGADASGRRLNFLVQEIGREVNTVGSKASSTAIAHLAVGMKEELEKIREQVQNVE